MRDAALATLLALAHNDPRIVCIAQDAAFTQLLHELPAQHIHEGISEAHCVSMATALALDGYIPYIIGTASFVVRRCYEQLLLDACLHQVPLRILGAAAGSFYAHWGPTHLCLDDVALMRCLPGMTVCAPSCADEVTELLPQCHALPGPCYVRLTMGRQNCVDFAASPAALGKGKVIFSGKDVLVIVCGALLQPAFDAVTNLRASGLDVGLLHISTPIPLDATTLLEQAAMARLIVTVEDHYIHNGLGSMTAEILAESQALTNKCFRRLGVPVQFLNNYGTQAEHLSHHGLDAEGLAFTISAICKDRP